MLHKIDCEQITCDNCKETFEEWGTGFSIFPCYALSRASDCDWHISDKHYCPKCYDMDDDDNLTIVESRYKN